MHYTYIIESVERPGVRYIGCTSDLRRRLDAHSAGCSRHTSKNRPWRLKLYIAFETRQLALRFERYLKSGSGHAFAKRHFWDR